MSYPGHLLGVGEVWPPLQRVQLTYLPPDEWAALSFFFLNTKKDPSLDIDKEKCIYLKKKKKKKKRKGGIRSKITINMSISMESTKILWWNWKENYLWWITKSWINCYCMRLQWVTGLFNVLEKQNKKTFFPGMEVHLLIILLDKTCLYIENANNYEIEIGSSSIFGIFSQTWHFQTISNFAPCNTSYLVSNFKI